jgi:hypothetical protein
MSLQEIHSRAMVQAARARSEVTKARCALDDCVLAIKAKDADAFYKARVDFFRHLDLLTIVAQTSCQACYVAQDFWEELGTKYNKLALFEDARTTFGHTD